MKTTEYRRYEVYVPVGIAHLMEVAYQNVDVTPEQIIVQALEEYFALVGSVEDTASEIQL